MLKTTLILILIAVVIVFSIFFFNYSQLQTKMNNVIKNDYRNEGIVVDVHFGNYLQRTILEFNLKSISSNISKADVFRILLQFSEEMVDNNFNQIYLLFKGDKKFILSGNYFNNLGKGYSYQNSLYTMRTFPENLKNLDNQDAYPQWTGGILGVSNKQIEDFNDFHDKWYFNDIMNIGRRTRNDKR
jgi:hypothetical protein